MIPDKLNTIEEKPIFIVRPNWLATAIPTGGLFFFLILLVLYSQSMIYEILGIAFMAFPALIIVISVFYTSKYEFYESYFKRKYHGTVKNQMSYSQVREKIFFHHTFSQYSPRNRIILKVLQDGEELPFIINGNPKNGRLGTRLNDWLDNKIRLEGGKV